MNIIITGASRGIGFELAVILAGDRQNQVIALSRSRVGLTALQNKCGNNLHVLSYDLTRDDYHQTLIPNVKEIMKSVDILINNAGLLINKPFDQLNTDEFDLMFNANVKSAFLLSQALLPLFTEDAHIVNISSMGGYQGSIKFPGLSLYSSSKGALAILTECMAEELKDKKVKVNCLALGSAQTEMLQEAFPGYKAPLDALEMASFIADFAVRGHRWFNGKILPVSISTP